MCPNLAHAHYGNLINDSYYSSVENILYYVLTKESSFVSSEDISIIGIPCSTAHAPIGRKMI